MLKHSTNHESGDSKIGGLNFKSCSTALLCHMKPVQCIAFLAIIKQQKCTNWEISNVKICIN